MTEHADQLTAIVETIQGITDIGRIHDRPRRGDAHSLWITNVDGIDQVRAWEIGLRDPGVEQARLTGGGHHHRYRNWQIRGWFSLIEPSDLAQDGEEANPIHDTDFPADNYLQISELAEQISDALNANRPLVSVANPAGTCIDLTLPPQVSEPQPLTIGGGFICWSVTIDFDAYTIQNP